MIYKTFLKFLLRFLILIVCIPFLSVQAAPDIPFRTMKLSSRVLFIKTGESPVMSNVTAIATSKGIVMIDSHYKPEWGWKIRSIAEETFGRRDFAYLIYSHAGVDHMGGVPAFSDTVIIGHDNCISQIDSLHRTIEDIDIRTGMAPRLKLIQEQMDAGPLNTALKTNLREAMTYWSELAELIAAGFRYSKPSITFSDKLTLQMGDLSLELSYCTPGYSQSDIVIHIPQEKLLVVGDIFVKHRIPLFNEKTDINRWAEVFKPFIEGKTEISHIIGCHGALMSKADLKAQLDYLIDLWTAVEILQKKGLNLEQAKLELSFNKRYAHLGHLITRWVGTPFDLHERNIEQVWKAQSSTIH